MFLKIEAAIYTKELQSDELNQAKLKLEYIIKDETKAEIIVKNTLYDGVNIFIGKEKMVSKTIKSVKIKWHNNHVAMFAL